MAMTVIKGATVTFTFGSVSLKIASLSISTGQGTFDVSAFQAAGGSGSSSYVHRIGGGLKDLAGSAAGFVTTGAPTQNPFSLSDATGTMTIGFDALSIPTCSVSFPAIIGALSIDVTRSGVAVFRFDWSIADGVEPTVLWA